MTPTTQHLIAVYGTLKQGYSNYRALMPNSPLLGTVPYTGIMQTNGWFPRMFATEELDVTKDKEKTYELQLFKVDTPTFERIERMEKGAGYNSVLIDTPLGKATMYISKIESFHYDKDIIDKFTE
jgi:gamma-glutamylcyclotransferase (GGCT)/AIG2-like uncharacterized protein YtfP